MGQTFYYLHYDEVYLTPVRLDFHQLGQEL